MERRGPRSPVSPTVSRAFFAKKEAGIRSLSIPVWILAATAAVAMLPLWSSLGVRTCQCDAAGCAILTGQDATASSCCSSEAPAAPSRSSCGAPSVSGGSCCGADASTDAPEPTDDRPAPERGGCDCPLCFCSLTTIQLAVSTPMGLEFSGARVAFDEVARTMTPQLFGADLFHPPSA